MKKQRGYIRIEGLEFIVCLALIGFLAITGGTIFAVVWVWQHIQFI